MFRRERVLLSMLIVTIVPPKDTKKYSDDDEAVQSNIKEYFCYCYVCCCYKAIEKIEL